MLTLGPLQLRPPFTGASVQSFDLRLTSLLNLPAPGRCQALYIIFRSIQQSPVFLINSRLEHFIEPLSIKSGDTFFRSYSVSLPSSLTKGHSSVLEYSSCLPVSVCGTGSVYLKHRRFSWEFDQGHYQISRSLSVLSPSTSLADLPTKDISTGFNPEFRFGADLSLLRPSIAVYVSAGILTSWPSASPFGYTLGPD